MSVDTGPIGRAAAELMERIEEEYGEEARFEAAVVIVDVSYKDEDDDECTTVQWRCAGPNPEHALSTAHTIGMARLFVEGLGVS